MTNPNLHNLVDELGREPALRRPDQLLRRVDAMERLESEWLHAGDGLASPLRQRGLALLAELEAVNRALYRSIRHDIRHGKGAATLRTWARALRVADDREGYDALDTLVGGVLDLEEPHGIEELDAQMVFYQPTPARHIFDFMARAAIGDGDVVFDLGSGLGHVTVLTAVCSTARCIGIEVQPAYVQVARACARDLDVRNACFFAQDVRQADLSEGTVFYLYTPFTGAILRTVLDMLRRQAQARVIRICTLGPCTQVVAGEPWLVGEQDACTQGCPAVWRSMRMPA